MSEAGMKGLGPDKRERERERPLNLVVVLAFFLFFILSSFLAHTFSAPNDPLGFSFVFCALLSLT